MTFEPTLVAKVIEVDRSLRAAEIGHAFGGAIALAYCAQPRATKDIDINVAVEPSQIDEVLDALPPGVEREGIDRQVVERDGQVRLWWGSVPIDVFFGFHPFHQQLAAHARVVPFANTEIPVIDGADLVVCKAMFDRSKDWVDIEAIARDGRADLDHARGWLAELLGADAPQLTRLDDITASRDLAEDSGPKPDRPHPGPGLGL